MTTAATMNLSLIVKAFDQASPQLGAIGRNLRSMFHGMRMLNVAMNRDMVMAGRAVRDALKPAGEELSVMVGQAKSFAKVVTGIALGSAGIGLLFKKNFLGVGNDIEKIGLRLRAFEGDQGRANQVMAWLRSMRDATGETMESLADAWFELRTKNIDPTRGSFKALAEAAAATGKPISAIAKIYADALEGKTGKFDDLGFELEKAHGKLVLTYEHMDKRIKKTLDPNDQKAVRAAIEEAITLRYAGASERAANSWAGLLKRLGAEWDKFALEVMSNGVFDALKDILRDMLAWVEKAKKDGTLKAWATDVADGIKTAISGAREAFFWLRDNLPPVVKGIQETVKWMGGWRVALVVVGGLLAGRLILSVLRFGSAVLSVVGAITRFGPALFGVAGSVLHVLIPALRALSVALLTTPAGWFILAVMAIAAAAWLIYDNWADIDTWFSGKWQKIKAAFDESWTNGIVQGLKEFAPVTLIAEALDALHQKLFGFSLLKVGRLWAQSLGEGLGQGFDVIVEWLRQKLEFVLGPFRRIATKLGWKPEDLASDSPAGRVAAAAIPALSPRAGAATSPLAPDDNGITPDTGGRPRNPLAGNPMAGNLVEGTINIVVTAADGAQASIAGMSATGGIDLAAVTRGRGGIGP